MSEEYNGEERRAPQPCGVHEEFIAQVAILTTHIGWFQSAGKWFLAVAGSLIVIVGGGMWTMSNDINSVKNQMTELKTIVRFQGQSAFDHYGEEEK